MILGTILKGLLLYLVLLVGTMRKRNHIKTKVETHEIHNPLINVAS